MKSLSRVQLFVTLWTVVHQAPPSMGFSRREFWSGSPFPSPGDLPNPRTEPGLPHCRQAIYPLSHQGSPKGCVVDSFCCCCSATKSCPTVPLRLCDPHLLTDSCELGQVSLPFKYQRASSDTESARQDPRPLHGTAQSLKTTCCSEEPE